MHPDQWNDRLSRMRAAGLNAIQIYIPWNFHEVYEGIPRFDGSRNVTHFLSLAAQNELYALVRIGPYVCAEWENGGLPWWLLKRENIRMRTSDVRFLDAVQKWFDILLPRLKPSLHKNGGPILMIQVENEYGMFEEGCDQTYTLFLRDLIRQHLGEDVLLYTTDPADYLKCGSIPGVFTTIDFGTNSRAQIDSNFATQRCFEPDGPLVNSEFYTGWIVTWHQKGRVDPSVNDLMDGSMYMFELGASFAYYMFFGGTNFAFWNGAHAPSAVITSYDYFAPLTEAADISEKYIAIRNWIKNIEGWPNPPKAIPENNPYVLNFYHHKLLCCRTMNRLSKNISASMVASLASEETLLHFAEGHSIRRRYPMSFEQLDHPFGFVAYRSRLLKSGGNLTISVIKDHGYIFVGETYQGMLVDSLHEYQKRWILINGQSGDNLTIIVENRGRQTFETVNDYKVCHLKLYFETVG
ncbi:unnamed protein product [Toxocara canis]|uniref:Glyco_hydro_35 domain-containing protein n=1 Tax=Toxocara canis TaxID=6265 RepID=A0A183V3R9_TOXCA|nr:unnamed protein product [Toxocara canis]